MMIFVIWILYYWIATFHLTFRSRVPFNSKRMMGHGVGPDLGLNEIKSPSSMMIFIIISYLFNCIFLPSSSPYLLRFSIDVYK